MTKIILIFILAILMFYVGESQGEMKISKKVKEYIEESKDWNEFLVKMSMEWKDKGI